MIEDSKKIEIVIGKLNDLQFIMKSFIDHAEEFQNKYSLEEELATCNAKKNALKKVLEDLGGEWAEPLD